MSLPKEHRDKILPGRRVRLAKGTEISSDHPSHKTKTAMKPYWVTVDRLEDDMVVWLGSGSYPNRAPISAVDLLEDYSVG